ncbi:tape measure protein [Acinetobacter ursingii]|uniref:Tape measure protein n=1 Tax=Acinetobacter ursingii TaxID=108980 RepID=A0AA46NIR5_9GAMM|nr:tape measure protein [Acinetobacter ursingii]UYF73030.1 tape measure protein [Acinetobacter ursingii]
MANKELVFKLVMDADVKNFVNNTKQSTETVQKMFDEIKQQSQTASQAADSTSKSVEKVGESAQQASTKTGQLEQSLSKTSDELKNTTDTANTAHSGLSHVGESAQSSVTGVAALGHSLESANAEIKATASADANLDKVGQDAQASVSGVKALEQSLETANQEIKETDAVADQASGAVENIIPKGTKELADSLTLSLTKATQIIDGAGDKAGEAANNFKDFGNKSSKAIDQLNADLVQAKQKLEQFSKTKATPEDIANAQAKVDALEKEVEQANQAFAGFKNSVDKANTATEKTSGAADKAKAGINGLKTSYTALVGAMAAIGIGLGLKELADTADAYTNLSTRVQIATKDGGNFQQAMAGVHQVALATNSSLEATGTLFTKINDVGKQIGLTQQQSLNLTKTINQAIQIGGGSAQASEAAITQLSQALQSGVLRGDEFNSIMEQAPGLASALAKGLGVTTGELRNMAEAGELTSERVVKAIQSQAASIQKTYDQFPLTIGGALQKIATSWQILIGEMDQANGASSTAAKWLSTLADNMSLLKPIIDDIGSGFSRFQDYYSTLYDQSTIDALKNGLVSAYEALKQLFSTLMDMSEATSDLLNTALSSLFGFTDALYPANEEASGLAKALNAINIAIGFLSDGFSGISIATSLLVGSFYSMAAAWEKVKSKFTWGDTKKEILQEMAEMEAKSTEWFNKATDGAAKFQSAGIAAILELGKTEEQRNADSVASSSAAMEKIFAAKQTEATNSKKLEADKLAAVQAYAEAAIKANGGVMDGTMQADLIAKGYIVTLDNSGKVAVQAGLSAEQAADKAAKKEEALKVAKENVQKADETLLEFQKKAAVDRAALEIQVVRAKQSGDLTELKSAQDKLNAIDLREAELTKARNLRAAEYDKINTGSGQVAENAYSRASAAAKLFGVDLDASLNKVSKSFTEGGNNLNDLSNKLTQAGITGKQAGDVLYQAWEQWLAKAQSQAEIDAAKAKMVEFEKQGVFSTKQVELGTAAISRAMQKLPDDIDPVEQAFERLGIKTKQQLQLAAQSALADFSTIQASGKATADQLKAAYERTMQAAVASGDQATIAAAKAKAASLGLNVTIDDTGKATVQTYDEMNRAADKHANKVSNDVTRAYREMGQVAREEAKDTITAWNDAMAAKSKADAESKTQRIGKDFTTYNLSDVQSKLTSMGYDEAEAAKLAKSIFAQATSVDKSKAMEARQSGGIYGDYYAKAYEDLINKGQTSIFGTQKIEALLAKAMTDTLTASVKNKSVDVNKLAPNVDVSTPTTNIEQPTNKTVKLEFNMNGQTAEVYTSEDNASSVEKMLREMEMLKKGM